MERVTPNGTVLYRFPEKLPDWRNQSQALRPIHRFGQQWTGLLASQGGPLAMRPEWSVRPGFRPWSKGAIVGRRPERPARRRRRRGRRSGRRHQQRRHRMDRDACRRPAPAALLAPRVLTCPERAALHRATPGAAPERGRREGDSRGARPSSVTRQPLRIGHVTARSLMPSIDNVIIALDAENLDVLGVSETWLSPSVDDSFLILPGYKVHTQKYSPHRWVKKYFSVQ